MSVKPVQYMQSDKIGYEGQLYTNNFPSIRGALRQFYNKTGARLPYGRAVCLSGTSKSDIKLPEASTDKPVGVLLFNDFQSEPYFDSLTTQGLDINRLAAVLTKGVADVIVYSETPTEIDQPVYFRWLAATGKGQGQFSSVVDATAFSLFPEARFVYKITSPGLTVINLGNF